MELWKGGIETMLAVPPHFETLVLAPCATDSESIESFGNAIEKYFPYDVAFAMTAFDPPGVERTREENAEENDRLWHEDLANVDFKEAWRGFGVDLEEKWREDGFVLSFDDSRRDEARAEIIAIARKYQQGAIYEYTKTDRGALRRKTVGAVFSDQCDETPMRKIEVVDHELFRLEWAGPRGKLFKK